MKNLKITYALIASLTLIPGLYASTKGKMSVKEKPESKIICIDSIRLLRESDEGKSLEHDIQSEVADFEAFVKKSQQEIAVQEESLRKQKSILSKEQFTEKREQIDKSAKRLKRDIEDRGGALQAKVQRVQIKLRDAQLKVINKEREEKKWGGLMIERNNPFMLGISDVLDKTDEALKVVNNEYNARQEKDTSKVSKS